MSFDNITKGRRVSVHAHTHTHRGKNYHRQNKDAKMLARWREGVRSKMTERERRRVRARGEEEDGIIIFVSV